MSKKTSFASLTLASLTFAVVSLTLCAAHDPLRAQQPARRGGVRLVTREVPLGRAHPGELKDTRTLSPDRRHIAFVAKVPGGERVVFDGAAGKVYPMIANDPLSEAGTGSPITFSPDGRRYVYVAHLAPAGAQARGPRAVVVDGKEGAPFDYVWSGAPHFSADGRRFAHTAERGGKHYAVVDGVESKAFDRVWQPAFSKDGARASFSAERGGRRLIVVDGVEFDADDADGPTLSHGAPARGPRVVEQEGKKVVVWGDRRSKPFDEVSNLALSAAGGRVTFEGKRDGREFAVVDGAESKPYEEVAGIYVSPDGGRVLFVARHGEGASVVVDGKEGEKYNYVEIEYPSPFSPDGRRYAYKATRETGADSREHFVVADGRAGKPYDLVDHVAFAPDGRLLYLAYRLSEQKTIFVVDGEEVASYDNTPGYGLFRFSPDGKRLFFRLNKLGEGKETLVLDGRAFSYDEIKTAEFGPGGQRFVFKARRGRGWVMVVDGEESEVYEADGGRAGEVEWGGKGELAFSPDGGRVAYVARKGGKDFVMLDGAAGARYDDIANLAFTPDGRHVVHTARRAGKSLVVASGVEGREYDGFVTAGKHEKEGKLSVAGDGTLSILARRGTEFLRVEIEIAGG